MTTEIQSFALKLLDKTKQARVSWKETYSDQTFICSLGGDVSFEVSHSDSEHCYYFEMKDDREVTVFRTVASQPDSRSTQENDNDFALLSNLFEAARRSALNLDEKVAKANKLLDEL